MQNVLIIGSGVSGKGAKDAIASLGGKAKIFDEKKKGAVFPSLDKFDLVVVSPSVSISHKIYSLCAKRGIEVISEVELGARLFSGTIVGITGTNGKTTVTRLVGDILRAAKKSVCVCGNIGTSFAKAAVEKKSEFASLELSSFQLEQMGRVLRPKIAMILNIFSDHLDRHKTLEGYANAKLNIAKNQTSSDFLLLSFDDINPEYLKNFSPKAEVFFVSTKQKVDGAYLQNGTLFFNGEPIIKEERLSIKGEHNTKNALFAILAASLLGINKAAIVKALSSFTPDNHRLKLCATKKGKRYYNDSKGTNIAACLAACNTMVGTTLLILGGSDKGEDFTGLFKALPQNVRLCFCIGQTADRIMASARLAGFLAVEKKGSLAEAVTEASLKSVTNVLLSPACASFDKYKSYEERGEEFEELVKKL